MIKNYLIGLTQYLRQYLRHFLIIIHYKHIKIKYLVIPAVITTPVTIITM